MPDRARRVQAGPPVRLGRRTAADPVRTGWDDVPAGQAATTSRLRLSAATAATTLPGHRAVTARPDGAIELADNRRPEHLHAPLWLTLGAALAGDPVELLLLGAVTEPSWSWAPGPVFLGHDGVVTQSAPAAPGALFLAALGVATAASTLYLSRQPSILLT